MSSVHVYSIFGYGNMIADRARMESYANALRQVVHSDSVVLDIGTGTGILALLACQYGARKVYAIEPGDCIQVAREIAAANNYGDRLVFIQDVSADVTLPERADVIVSDLRGVLPLCENHLPTIADARHRLLAPGGALIPRQDTLWAALVSAPDLYRKIVGPYLDNPYNLDMRAACRLTTNTWHRAPKLKAEHVFSEPQRWATLDYTTLKNSDVKGKLDWNVESNGTVHGLCLWFDSILAEGIQFSNAPGEPELVYGRAFFPWTEPVHLAIGDRVSINLNANLLSHDYLWRWDTRVLAKGRTDGLKEAFEQSTFHGKPLSLAQLHKRTDQYVPELNEGGRIHHFILDTMKIGTPLGEIVREVSSRFPKRFPTWQQALDEVAKLSEKHSE